MDEWLTRSWDSVFKKFSSFGKERSIDRGEGSRRFLYIPGSRSDRVVLVAHADSVWGGRTISVKYDEELRRFSSANKNIGIGADDRAGCAMLWELRDSGHSLLITGNEEEGSITAMAIMEYHDIAEELNAHRFMVQFDRRGSSDFKCYDVGTDDFRSYVAKELPGYSEPNRSSFTDICALCYRIPGVNLSIGYYKEHTKDEYLLMDEWEHTLHLAKNWLEKPDLPEYLL